MRSGWDIAARRWAACFLVGPMTLAGGAAFADVIVNNNAGEASLTSHFTQSEASVLVFGSTVLVGYDDSGSNAGNTNKFVGWSRSTDGGVTFTDMGTLPTNPNGDAGDARLARSALTGTVFMSTIAFNFGGTGTQLFRSTDGGLTFNAPVNATPGINADDTHSVAVDNFAGSGAGTVYVAARSFGSDQGIYFFKSTDDGLTFGSGILIASASSFPQSPIVTVGTDHSINVTYYDRPGGIPSIVTRRSTDGGATFGPPVTVTTLASTNINSDLGLVGLRSGTASPAGFRSNGFPQVKVNPLNGHMYVTYTDNPAGADKADVFYRISTDNGLTWSAPVRINSDATLNDQWSPNMAVTPDGSRVGFFWYDRRNDVNNNRIEYFGLICSVNGASFICGTDFAVSDVDFLPEFGRDVVVNPTYMGDQDFADADNNWFYVAWGDKRNAGLDPRMNPDVFFDRIAISSVPVPGTLALLGIALAGLGFARRHASPL